MSQRLIICAAESRSQANRIVGHLINGGFAEYAISVLFASTADLGKMNQKKRFMANAGVGALLGGAFVWLTGMGVLSMPGLGSLVIAGAPLAAAIGHLTRGGVADMLRKMGLSHTEAELYESQVRQGRLLISVRVSGDAEAIAASRVIQAVGVRTVADTGVSRACELSGAVTGTMLECGASC